MTRLRWIAAGLVLAFILGFGVYACRGRQVFTQTIDQANQHHEQGAIHDAQGAVHDQAAAKEEPILKADSQEVARLRAEVARLRAASSRPAPLPPTPGLPKPEPAGPPVETPLEATKTDLIDALTKENGDLKTQNAELKAARDGHREASAQYQQETASLRVALRAIPAPRTLALGLLYGTNNTTGAWIEKDFGPLRIGADVVRRQIPATNQTTTDANLRLGITF
jgi:hypothetical protein